MKKRTSLDPSEAIGTDAFLDIVANLVGILLILIMVIGVRMDGAADSNVTTTVTAGASRPVNVRIPALEPLPIEIPNSDAARLEVSRFKASIHEAQLEARKLAELTKFQKLDRDNLMLAITNADLELERRRGKLDETQRGQLETDLALQKSNEHYQSLLDQLESAKLAAAQKTTEVIQHIATPLAQTVFVREEHFRLKDGKLVYVPLNSMTEQLRSEAKKKMWKLENSDQITETIGPRERFYLRYTLQRSRTPLRTEAGTIVRDVVELDRFVLIPVSEDLGETVAAAMTAGSEFLGRLNGWNPKDTVVTVWTYPEDFKEFRQLKASLYELGYLTAARPLPEGQLISGSPHGTRSAAQ